MVSSVSDKAPVSTNASCPRTGSIKMARSPRVYRLNAPSSVALMMTPSADSICPIQSLSSVAALVACHAPG